MREKQIKFVFKNSGPKGILHASRVHMRIKMTIFAKSNMKPLLSYSMICGAALMAAGPVYDVEVEKDVVYAVAEGYWTEGRGAKGKYDFLFRKKKASQVELKMDIYKPEGSDAGNGGGAPERPLLLMFHGGAYYNGSKNELGQTEWRTTPSRMPPRRSNTFSAARISM